MLDKKCFKKILLFSMVQCNITCYCYHHHNFLITVFLILIVVVLKYEKDILNQILELTWLGTVLHCYITFFKYLLLLDD